MKTLSLCLLMLCALAGCTDDPPPPVEPEPAAPSKPALPEPERQDPEPTADEVPIVEDFEDEAKAEVKPDNLNAQLDALEKEIEQDSQLEL